MCDRGAAGRRREPAHRRRLRAGFGRGGFHFFGARLRYGDIAGHAFLQ
jgi:hypothetical protein